MSGIEELQRRVVEAEERFGLINEERAKYSERLMSLISAIEAHFAGQQAEISRQASEIASQGEELTVRREASHENKLLRGMLHSLLRAIEEGGRDTLSETMQTMDAKISALLSGGASPAPIEAVEAGEDPAPAADPGETQEAAEPDRPALEADGLEAAPEMAPEAAPETASAEAETDMAQTAQEDEAAEDIDTPAAAEVVTETAVEMPDAAEMSETNEAAPDDGAAENPATRDALADIAEPGVTPDAALEMKALEPPATVEQPAAEDAAAAEPEISPAPESLEEPTGGAEEALDESGPDAPRDRTGSPEALKLSGAGAEATAEPGLENLVDDEQAAPDIPAVAPGALGAAGANANPEATSLEDIMRRVSKLVEEEGALGPLSGGGVSIGPEGGEAEAADPDPAEAPMTASNG